MWENILQATTTLVSNIVSMVYEKMLKMSSFFLEISILIYSINIL